MRPTLGFVTQLGIDLDDCIRFAGREGFDYVEVLMDGDNRRGSLAERAGDVRSSLAATDLDAAVHLPFPIDLGSPHDRQREGGVAELRACLDVAADLGAGTAVVHPTATAWDAAWDGDRLRPLVYDSLDRLADHAGPLGIELCAENIFGSVHTVAEMPALLEETTVSMTLDTGHARVSGYDEADTAAFVADHADRVRHVHLNDTRRPADEHLPFGAGTIDFEPILGAFPEGWDGSLSLEVGTRDLDYIGESKRRLETVLERVDAR
ncbi:sugar phosphate isomerase/epimerase family protein [Halobaculum gomorrense]|uniref:sugar phosphate isomerase/epimerase family protein n=1 Tax=Halobaculum gomorrense TaxID=43928 RepID=UPI0013565222|nr:sugar phosphate isomerase/epimerase family protein [Halobaculum gomorrense]